MAKQNVTFVERHLEKMVAGTAGAVLLFVLVTNVLLSPHAVDTGGESRPPGAFYAAVADQAAETQRRMQTASGIPSEVKQKSDEMRKKIGTVAAPYPLELPVAAVPLSPPIPQVGGGPGPGIKIDAKVQMAEILPPTQPILTVGKAAARLALPRIEAPDSTADTSADDLDTTKDLHWVTGAGVIDRKTQRAMFERADYLSDRRELIVAEVRVERREQMPSGLWGEPVVIRPYASRRIEAKPSVEIVPEGGSYVVSTLDGDYIGKLRQMLEGKDAQAQILRPPFQSFLVDTEPREDDTAEWQIPTVLKAPDGTEVNMAGTDFGVVFFDEDGEPLPAPGTTSGFMTADPRQRPGAKPRPPRPGADPATGAPAVNFTKQLQEIRKQATELIPDKKTLQAKDVAKVLEIRDRITALAGLPDLNMQQKKQVDDLNKDYQIVFEQAEMAARRQQGSGSPDQQLPDLDPFWFTDNTVEPGKTYQYRTCAVAMNQYAGMATRVWNVDDARKLLIQGQWSEWSKAVTVPPAKYMFVTEVPSDGGRVAVELCRWERGTWEKIQTSLLPGERVAANKGKDLFDYGAILLSADPLRPFVKRTPQGKSDAVKYAPENTGAVVLVNAQGDIEEHFVSEDAERRKEVNQRIARDKQRRDAAKPMGVSPVQPQRTPKAPLGRPGDGEDPRPAPRGGQGRTRG